MDENIKAFVVHVSSLSLGPKIIIHLAKKVQIALLFAKNIAVSVKYSDFANDFLEKSANVLSEQTEAIKQGIVLEYSRQPPYTSIYSLWSVEFKTLKTYIKINLTNGLISASKSPESAPILFGCKCNGSLHWFVNYWGFNNLTIKSWYLLALIGKLSDQLNWATQFTQLDLTNVYYWIWIKENDK